jgi:hypothetical protein
VRAHAGLNLKKTITHCSASGRNSAQIIDMYITFLNYFRGSSTSSTGSLMELGGACTHSHRTTTKNSVLFTFSSSPPKVIWILIIFFTSTGDEVKIHSCGCVNCQLLAVLWIQLTLNSLSTIMLLACLPQLLNLEARPFGLSYLIGWSARKTISASSRKPGTFISIMYSVGAT